MAGRNIGGVKRAGWRLAAGAWVLLVHAAAAAADLKVLGVEALRPAVNALVSDWSHETGHLVSVAYAGAAEVRARLASGERPDLVLLSRADLEALDREGRVERSSLRFLGTGPASAGSEATAYAAAALKSGQASWAAALLADHLASPAGRREFRERGFTVP